MAARTLSHFENGSQGFLSTGSIEMLSCFKVLNSNMFGELAGNEFSAQLLLSPVHHKLGRLTDMCQKESLFASTFTFTMHNVAGSALRELPKRH